VFLSKNKIIFTKRKFTFSEKALKYFVPKIYKAFRATNGELYKELEELEPDFNDFKYLVLRNPINVKSHLRIKLQKYLKEFPWLCSYRQLLVKFYYQFRVSREKRLPLSFLSRLTTDTYHPWLKSAVQTLIDNEENVFRFQHVPE